ncbi:uncharacterized protein LOC133743984 [Rosa rugosa]|uniref:uncharacterized protein LOC133743984 n=1 Tax=Rosa rugosa TaxID=74645 RepID=UPI002B406C44|nr:uncharacterized protein LOC133743984 [Rosa rugosa]
MRIERPPLPLACNDVVNLLSIILIPESNFVDTRDGPESPKSPIAKSPSQNSLRNASLSCCQKENVCCVPGWKVPEQNTRENEEQSGYLLKTQFAKYAEEMLFGLSSPLLTFLPSAGSLAEEDVKMASCADEIYIYLSLPSGAAI